MTVQEALELVAANPSMDELMSRRPASRKDIRLQIALWRAERVRWAHAADLRAERREENEAADGSLI